MSLLDLSCPLAWPSTSTSTDYPLRQRTGESPRETVRRLYWETLWLPEELVALQSVVPALRRLPGGVLVDHLGEVFLPLDGIERKYRVGMPFLLSAQTGAGAGGEAEAEAHELGQGEGEGEEVRMMRFVYKLRERAGVGGGGVHEGGGEGDGEELEEDRERDKREWFDQLERREVQLQLLLRLLQVTLPPARSPRKRKRPSPSHAHARTPVEEIDILSDRLAIWHALGSVLRPPPGPGSTQAEAGERERDWVTAWAEDVLGPLFDGTGAEGLVRGFREKLDPTISPPSSPVSSSGEVVLPLPVPGALDPDTAASRSGSFTSVNLGAGGAGVGVGTGTAAAAAAGYRRSMSVSSTQSSRSVISVSGTRTGVNNSKNWAGKEVRMGRRAIGGARPRQASLPPAPPPPQPARPFRRAESQMLVMSTPVKKPIPRPEPSSADEVMETPQKGV
ncbi:hypothetical protein DACRYDRAFT_103234 [Dacryopinax primogenitus]|uniref:DNA replication regulator Sld3 C-terminal domain-containing protein n=1 Tax=Dacryopinax primogenitus (strain DJM 731) TaxID=1858805 RepID=M5GFH2_DACPD|nr:uncharacterized protein DACRYDRAFT_103234 [Dacryopinax primogenitus]EJU06287.1 hypothetical protein DACRYDRAFT_103234 [Dacryopinax primogenitus]